MKKKIRKITTPLFPVFDVLLAPFTLASSLLLFGIRKIRIGHMPISKWIFKKVGVFPIVDHYYEPLFNDKHLKHSLEKDRSLLGIAWNKTGQLDLLQEFAYEEELRSFPMQKTSDFSTFYFENPSFGPADAEYLYSIIRHSKPKRIIEIGSGYSTLMARHAILENKKEDKSYNCEHICIEPYEMKWLEKIGVTVIRKLVEQVELSVFKTLEKNDILFIDSSHVLRPQGDVLYEMLEILPSVNKGVIIHVHDIFSPRDYTKKHIVDDIIFWNEQYVLEAFLTCNDKFEIIGALNYLKNHHPDELSGKFPVFKNNPHHEPGSFWIRRN
jgi:predicted O-methyltransferase YrrM